MTTEQKTQFIRDRCVVANPSIALGEHEHYGDENSPRQIEIEYRPLTLEDILMATEQKWRIRLYPSQNKGEDKPEGHLLYYIVSKWSLGKPFTSQSEELKNFVYEILK